MSGQAGEKRVELLLEVADWCDRLKKSNKGKDVGAKIRTLIDDPVLNEYGLDDKDVRIISWVFGAYLDARSEGVVEAKDILRTFEKDRNSTLSGLKRIERLIEVGILEVQPRKGRLDGPHNGGPVVGFRLLGSMVSLSADFLDKVYGTEKEDEPAVPYESNLEYLSDQFRKIEVLKEGMEELIYLPKRIKRWRHGGGYGNKKNLTAIEKRIEKRLSLTQKTFPFEEFKRKKKLNKKEELVVAALLEGEASGFGYDLHELLYMVSGNGYERLSDRAMFSNKGSLARLGIIEFASSRRFSEDDDGGASLVKLNENLSARLLGTEVRGASRRRTKTDFFEFIRPSVPLDNVILHPKTASDISLARDMIKGGTADILREWGVKGANLAMPEAGRKKSHPLTVLFYGAPGTGKTLAANAMTHALKRELITFDCSKILGSFVGESEKNTRKIFDSYREQSKCCKRPPVLLLNEADQFLHRRISAGRATDYMYNQMQNIFLEQLERFEGVLIATTNLKENLDSAFSRRFHMKIEFRRPGPAERLRLWQLHLPPKAPLAEDVDLGYLSERFDFSGAQIAVVIRNAAGLASRKGDILRQADFVMASEEELASNFDEKARRGIGFER
jgi:Cdc6-like AAA superfamily ATPase